MIEQLMITANQAAAKLAKSAKLPFVYRIHEQPDPDRVDSLAELVNALGFNPVSLRHRTSVKTADFAAIMEQAEGKPAQKVISHQLLRTMAVSYTHLDVYKRQVYGGDEGLQRLYAVLL